MEKYALVLLMFAASILNISAQNKEIFRLSYDVPESPAFAVLDANPTQVMRGSAAKELAVSVANNFLTKSQQQQGVALDFAPYFLFNGTVKSVEEYRNNYFKRLLANTQLSMASIVSEVFPDDNLFSAGVRITLFDQLDELSDDTLIVQVSNLLIPSYVPPPGFVMDDSIVDIDGISDAYEKAQRRKVRKKGLSVSMGAAVAKRLKGGILSSESSIDFREEVWLASQYSFGNGGSALGMLMYRNTEMPLIEDSDEIRLGAAYRYLRNRTFLGVEGIYSSSNRKFDFGINAEHHISPDFIISIEIGNRHNDTNGENEIRVMPELRYNFGSPK